MPQSNDNITIDWQALRNNHGAAENSTFLNAGSRGIMSRNTAAAVQEALAAEIAVRAPSPAFPQQLIETRGLFERLIKAEAGTVAATKNTSEGLNAVATAVDWRAGDSIVICSEVEHANNVYLWLNLATQGVELRDIPARGGAIDTERMAAAIDHTTRLVSVTAVSFVPGFRTDYSLLSEACRQHDALLLVDGVQACGILDIDVQRDGISALATSTSKGLLGLRGFGFLYVAPGFISRLKPAFVARNSFDTGGKHYSEFEKEVALCADARRFEWGTYNYLGLAAARRALSEITAIGTEQIEARTTRLAHQLAAGLLERGLPVVCPPDDSARAHLVTVGTYGAGDAVTTGDRGLDRFAARLQEVDVQFSIRRGLIRFGFHFYNNEEDVEKVLEVASKWGRE